VLFFKTDRMEHKEKLRTIFPYVLGATTPELLAKRWEIENLERELKRKKRELDNQRQASAQWRTELQTWVSEARDLGLLGVDATAPGRSEKELLAELEKVTKKTSSDSQPTEGLLDAAAVEVAELEKEDSAVSLDLSETRSRTENMTLLRSAVDEYTGALKKQRERLQLSRWLRDLADSNEARCPLCEGQLVQADNQLNALCDALATVEATARRLDPVPAVFDQELVKVKGQARVLAERLKGVRTRRVAVEASSARIRDERWRHAAIDRFIGRMEQALKILNAPQGDLALATEVEELGNRLKELRATSSDGGEQEQAALKRISASMARLLPVLDSERPGDLAELDIDELTIRVAGRTGRSDFLWEIGSAANWLSYHVAALLGLHELFLSQKGNPVPSVLVLDQPSQGYFPQKLAGKPPANDDPLIADDEDVTAVKKIFDVLGASVNGKSGSLQLLVLDHAGSNVWGDSKNVHLVEEWRDGRALVPREWLT
jgi:Protein of unknown function (DUF3732)